MINRLARDTLSLITASTTWLVSVITCELCSDSYSRRGTGERGVLFACQPQGGHPAHVRYKPYTAWSSAASHQEWTYDLGGNIAVIGLAAGGSKAQKSGENDDDTGNLVVATSDNDLTFLSGNKTERFIMGLDGDFVAMVAGEEWVFYVHRPGATTIDGAVLAMFLTCVEA